MWSKGPHRDRSPLKKRHFEDRLEFAVAAIDAARHEGHEGSPGTWVGVSCSFRQRGQYQGAGVLTGFGLLLRQRAQRKRLPLTAVFGRTFFPLLKMLFAIGTSPGILAEVRFPSRQRLRLTS